MWWLLLTSFQLSTATPQGHEMIATPNVKLSTMGYDPLFTDVMEHPDQATRLKIFDAHQRDSTCVEKKEHVLNNFVSMVKHSRCSPYFTEAVAHTYEEYKSLTTAAISFVTEDDASTPLGDGEFNFKDNAGYGNINNPNSVLIREFFNDSENEIRLVKVKCVTHTVSIHPFNEPVFTTAFKSALFDVHEAAMDTNLETRKKVFNRFIRSYGTHFARTTHFGYMAHFVKLFATKAKTPTEEVVRSRCMMESARETLTPGARMGCETTGQHFSRVVADKCGEEKVEELVTETGSASVNDVRYCDLAANESPRPMAYFLEKISALFEEAWTSSLTLETRQVRLNGTALSTLFEEQLGKYSQDVIKKAETPSSKQGSWRRSITPKQTAVVTEPSGVVSETYIAEFTGPSEAEDKTSTAIVRGPSEAENKTSTAVVTGPTEAEDKASSVVNGTIIIVGGKQEARLPPAPYSTALFGSVPPPFPVGVEANTLSRLGTKIYSCGGYDNRIIIYNKCWVLDTETPNDTWKSFDIEWAMVYHSAVVVNQDIWFFFDSRLRILQPRNGVNIFRQIDLGFRLRPKICAVAHGSQTFVIGANRGKGDVYMNANYINPEEWELFSTLLQGRYLHSCIVSGGEIIVTGGLAVDSRTRLSSVEAISLADGSVRSLAPLAGVRMYHQMAIIHGRPAVLGGWNGNNPIATIETYDEQRGSWETLGDSLSEPRYSFGLTQYFN